MIFTPQGGLKKNRMDWALFLGMLVLVSVGTIAVFSSVAVLPQQARILRVQLIAIPLGLLAFSVAWSLNYQIYQDQWKYVYGILLVLLAGVLVFGVVDKGARSWYRLPFFSVQPSEFARVGLILVLANFLDKRMGKIREMQTVLGAFALCVPVFFLLIEQPDFSGILLTFPVAIIMLYTAGASVFHLFIIVGYGFISGLFPILWTMITLNPELQDNALVNYFFHLSDSWMSAFIFVAGVAVVAWLLWRLSGGTRDPASGAPRPA